MGFTSLIAINVVANNIAMIEKIFYTGNYFIFFLSGFLEIRTQMTLFGQIYADFFCPLIYTNVH